MLVEKDDLGLSLGISAPEARCPLQVNLMPLAFEIGYHSVRSKVEASPEVEERMKVRGIDVNRAPATELEINEDAGAFSPNSASSAGSHGGKRGHDEEHDERDCSRGASDEEDGEGSRKKLRLSKDQSAVLEESFKGHNTLNPKRKLELAKQLNLRPRQVEVWFQNRRARTKLKQTEVDCEFLKRCCENLTEENRRLQKEVQELRSLKLSPQFRMHMTPPTTLTMCPSCERVALTKPAAGQPTPAKLRRVEHQLFPRPKRPQAAAVGAPWTPIGLRPSFLDTPPQRS